MTACNERVDGTATRYAGKI